MRQIKTSGWIPIWRSAPTECCVGLVLSSAAAFKYGTKRQVDVQAVLPADVERELADRLQERQTLDVADGPADLGDHHVDVVGRQAADRRLDLVGHMGNHLHRLAFVERSLALLLNDREIDLARRVVAVARRAGRG